MKGRPKFCREPRGLSHRVKVKVGEGYWVLCGPYLHGPQLKLTRGTSLLNRCRTCERVAGAKAS